MFLKKFKSDYERYFNSYRNSSLNGYGYGYITLRAFNSCGIKCIERAYDNDGLFIVIENKKIKIEIDLYTSICKKNGLRKKIMKDYIFRNIIEESSRGMIIQV